MPQPSASSPPHAAPLDLPANGTRIVFLHAHDTGLRAPCAVQVDVKTSPASREVKAEENLGAEISDLLVKLVVSHLRTPLPLKFILDGGTYSVTATRKKWTYGQKKLLMTWGDERIVPCEDKWSFVFVWNDKACSSYS